MPGLFASLHEPQLRAYELGPFSLKDSAIARYFSNYGSTAAGIAVNEHIAFTCSGVWCAVNGLSSDIGKLPLDYIRRDVVNGKESKQPYVGAKLYRLVHDQPNEEMTAITLRSAVTAHALTWGNGYAEIERDGAGRPAAFWPITPNRVSPYRERQLSTGRLGPLRYRIDGGRSKDLAPADLLHIPGLSFDGSMGYNVVIEFARQAIGLALASERFAASFFGNSSIFGGVLASKGTIDPEQKAEITASIEALHKSADKAHKFLVLGSDFSYSKLGVDPSDSQMKETREFQLTEIARYFDYPLHRLKMAMPGAVSYASVEANALDYYKGPMLTWVKRWEQELNAKCVPSLEYRRFYFKHNMKEFLRADMSTQTEANVKLRNAGVLNADEIRDQDDLNPQPDGQGAIYLVQGAMVPADRLHDIIDKQTTPSATDAEVATAKDRASRAEAAAAEARAVAEDARRHLAAAEAAGLAANDELARLVTAEGELRAVADRMVAHADGLRLEVEQQRVAVAATVAEFSDARRHVDRTASDAEAQRTAAENRASQALERAAESLEAARAARADLEAALQEKESERARAALAEADMTAAIARAEAAAAARQAAEEAQRVTADTAERLRADLAQAQEALADAMRAGETTHAAAIRDGEHRVAAVQAQLQSELEARASCERRVDELTTLAARATAAREDALAEASLAMTSAQDAVAAESSARTAAERSEQQARADAAAAREALAVLSAERDRLVTDAAADREEHRGHVDAIERLLESRETQVAALTTTAEAASARAARADALQASAAKEIAAHRDLVVDIMRRLIDFESERAAKQQRSEDRLLQWVESAFYEGHLETMQRALLPAVRIHLAFVGSDDDPSELARRLAHGHIAESQRQLRIMADGGGAGEFAPSVQRLLRRWEDERITVIADLLMQKELEYVRRRR